MKSREITPMDAVVLVPMLAVIVFLSLYPQGALKRSEDSVSASVAAAHLALTPGLSTAAFANCSPRGGSTAADEICVSIPAAQGGR